MQDTSDEFPLPNIKSHKLRQYLYSRPDLLRTLTPPRSNYSQSQLKISGPISFDFINPEYSQRPMRKSGSFDALHSGKQNRTYDNHLEKQNVNDLFSYVSSKGNKSDIEFQNQASKQEPYLIDLLNDGQSTGNRQSDSKEENKEELKSNRTKKVENPKLVREFTYGAPHDDVYIEENPKSYKQKQNNLNLLDIDLAESVEKRIPETRSFREIKHETDPDHREEIEVKRKNTENLTKVPALDIDNASKKTPKANYAKPSAMSARVDNTKIKEKPSMIRGFSPRTEYNSSNTEGGSYFSVKPENCRHHANNQLAYVCIKDNCGELLCPLCLFEHQKVRHIGDYESLTHYGEKLKYKLADAYESLITSIEKIVDLQSEMTDKGKFEMEICEEITRVEDSLIKNIKQFFDNLRDEYRSEVFFDHQKLTETLEKLHEKSNQVIQNLEEDLKYFSVSESLAPSQFLGQLVQKNYHASSQDVQKTLNNIDQRIRHFINSNSDENFDKLIRLELNPHLKSKFIVLLNEGIKVIKKKTPRTSNATETEQIPKQAAQNEDLIKYYKDLQKNEDSEKDSSIFSRDLEPIEEFNETPSGGRGRGSNEKEAESNNKSRARTVSPFNKTAEKSTKDLGFKKINDNISNTVLEIYKTMNPKTTGTQEKDLDIDTTKFLCEYMDVNFNTPKVKVFDHEFFQRLFNNNGQIDFVHMEKSKLYFDNVAEYLTTDPNSKHKSIFTAHERLFFLVFLHGQWTLAEIKTNTKTIIVYDYLGKFSKSKSVESIYGLLFEIIRYEYKTKLNQNPENFAWEKKIAHHPLLVSKNSADAGVLAIKIISNAYQNKDFTNNRVSPNEITMIKKKIEKVFKGLEDKKSGKFVPI